MPFAIIFFHYSAKIRPLDIENSLGADASEQIKGSAPRSCFHLYEFALHSAHTRIFIYIIQFAVNVLASFRVL